VGTIGFVHYETEGGECRINSISKDKTAFAIAVQCQDEESGFGDEQPLTLSLASTGQTITLQGQLSGKYHKCM
jgi:hypothetical protein